MDFTSILNQSLQQDVSDVFLTEGLPVSIRKHGSIIQLEQMITNLEPWLIKILSEQQWQQLDDEGDLDFGLQTDEHRFRLNIARSQGRWSVVARPLPSGRFSYEELGLPNGIRSFVQHRSGIVLVTGATGSGKSTTLAAMIHQLNSEQAYHIVTIEDPIEMLVPAFNQMQVNQKIAVDFAAGVRALMRQDPDIIMIGEFCALETRRMPIQSA